MTRDQVKSVSARTGQTADQVVAHALEEYERALFWRDYAAAAERDQPAEERAEQELWERTAADGVADA